MSAIAKYWSFVLGFDKRLWWASHVYFVVVILFHGITRFTSCPPSGSVLDFKISVASVVKLVFTNQLRPAQASQKYAIFTQFSPYLPRTAWSLSCRDKL